MTFDEFKVKAPRLHEKCRSVGRLSLKDLEAIIDDMARNEREKIFHRMEWTYRQRGGLRPIERIIKKVADTNSIKLYYAEDVVYLP